MIFRLSEKLKTKIKAGIVPALPLDDNPLADWSAQLFIADRVQYILLTNTASLYSTVMFGKGITNGHFIERALGNIRAFMEADGQEFAYHRFIVPATGLVRFAKALNRSVTGSMNDLIRHARYWLAQGDVSPFDVGLKLNEIPMSALQYVSPREAFKAASAIPRSDSATERTSDQAVQDSQGIGSVPIGERIYQFKIALLGINPTIWRRIQVKNCTLDKLHSHVQLAMGWENSHLHHFMIDDKRYGDPDLLGDYVEPYDSESSLDLKIRAILPKSGKRFSFGYEYDYGDGWEHEIVFEGCLRSEKGVRYPICVEGERDCPPEDVGGTGGYEEYLQAMADPEHERHEEFMGWRGPFDPAKFDPAAASKKMQRGLPDWRKQEWM
jgi:hypothetical protein